MIEGEQFKLVAENNRPAYDGLPIGNLLDFVFIVPASFGSSQTVLRAQPTTELQGLGGSLAAAEVSIN